jgi:hypothetical protein
MKEPNGKAALFALSLRREAEKRSLSVRRLGRLTDPANPERGRRRVQRHLSGSFMPSVASRETYADVLGLPRDFFLGADDDMEEPLTRATKAARELARTLERVS